jgi:uncharacterized protein YjbI with pentapeptide repeats
LPAYNEKLRAEAVNEFLMTEWMPDLELSTALIRARLEYVSLRGFSFGSVDFSYAKLGNADFDRANLPAAIFLRQI